MASFSFERRFDVKVLIIGCGYAGLALGRLLVERGHVVHGMRRRPSPEFERERGQIEPVYADISQPETLKPLAADYDWVANLVSSSKGGLEEYRRAYLEGTENVLRWLSGRPPRKYVYTSSTSVYAQSDGSAVTEGSAAEGGTATGQVLLATEELLIQASRADDFPAVILRVAGIYGPSRGHLFHQFLKGEARLAGDGDRYLNMIHRADLAGIIAAALERGSPGRILNAVDDEPVREKDFFSWLAKETGREMPPSVAASSLNRKRGLTSKRVVNRALKETLGYRFVYPTFREGYREELRRVKEG